jgi:iron complex outermembrane receptor protein
VPESGWNFDLGASLRLAKRRWNLHAELSGFASLVEDLIQFQQDAYGRARAANIGRARILGAEASLSLQLDPWVRVSLNGTFLDAHDVSDTSIGRHEPYLPNRPRFRFYARPEGRWPINGDVTIGAYVDVDITDGNYLDAANLVELPARLFVGAGLFAEATRLHLLVTASGQNLNDARTYDFSGFPLPSRSFFVSARISFNQENSRK